MGSYGSYGAFPAPLDIPATSYLSCTHHDTRSASSSWSNYAYSISDADLESTLTSQRPHLSPRASSYLSDDDLSDSFDDDAYSITSSGSNDASSSPVAHVIEVRTMTDEEVEEMQRAQAAQRQELMRFLLLEKERKRMAASTRKRRGSAGSTKKGSSKTRLSSMTPIAEAGE